ncbi:MAG: hypothetical protein PW788_04500 [Micavibrio sp.]|nr:hypothetical protein [Micavibrio sp.]
MDEETKKLVDAWIKMSEFLEQSGDEAADGQLEPDFWAAEKLFRLAEEDPEKAWSLMLAIRSATSDQKILAHLAASHFEDFINAHADKFIDRIEALAKEEPDFRNFIGGIWPRKDMPEELVERFKAIALKPHWD